MPRLTITVPDQVAQPYRFSLERQIVHFGRGDDNDIFIDCGSVSSEHAVMERTIGGYVLNDLGSTNGIRLNNEKVHKINLRNGQEIKLGDVDFGFELSDDEMTALRLEDPTSQLPPLSEDPSAAKPPTSSSSGPASPEIELKAEPKPQPKPKPEPEPEPRREPEPQPEPEPEGRIEPPQPQPQPQEQASPPPQQQVAATESAPQDNASFNKLIAVGAVVAFLVGIAMHFQRATEQSLIGNLLDKLGGG